MKKLVLGLILGVACLIGQAQVYTNNLYTLVDSLDLSTVSGADTTIYAFVHGGGPWSADVQFASITGSGTAEIVAGNHVGTLELYASTSTVTVTGSSGTLKYDHDRFAWQYIGVKITMGTISAGTLNVSILRR